MSKTIQEAIEEFKKSDVEPTEENFLTFLEGVDENTYTIECVGDFDSPGYDMWVYAVAYIEDGKPMLYGFTEESY